MNRLEHLLTITGEEGCEVAQRASKILRFGLNEIQPDQPLTNAERLVQEFADLYALMEMLFEAGVISQILDGQMVIAKKQKVEEFLKYSESLGLLDQPVQEATSGHPKPPGKGIPEGIWDYWKQVKPCGVFNVVNDTLVNAVPISVTLTCANDAWVIRHENPRIVFIAKDAVVNVYVDGLLVNDPRLHLPKLNLGEMLCFERGHLTINFSIGFVTKQPDLHRCPGCGHQYHYPDQCLNMASDNDCNCKWEPSVES